MASGDLLPKNLFNFPTITFPSILDDAEDLFPTTIWPSKNYLQGLSISEDDKKVYVEAAVPGIDPKDVEVTFKKGILTIKADKKEEEKTKNYHKKATSSFLYRVTPGDVDPKSEPEATCKNGVITISFSKVPEVKAKKIAVKTI